jgi:peptide/nickel transport system permease protein
LQRLCRRGPMSRNWAIVECVFGLGGLGQVSVQAVSQDNLPVIIGFVILAAVFVVVANIVVDLICAALDPRVRIT